MVGGVSVGAAVKEQKGRQGAVGRGEELADGASTEMCFYTQCIYLYMYVYIYRMGGENREQD